MYSTTPNTPPGPTSIRQITLAENFSLAFNTNGVYKNAVILGDVDNDIYGVRNILAHHGVEKNDIFILARSSVDLFGLFLIRTLNL
jgi:hypothetical protein